MKVVLNYLKVNTKPLKAYIQELTSQKVLSIHRINYSDYYNVGNVEYVAIDNNTRVVDLIRLSPKEFKPYTHLQQENKGGY